MYKLAALSLLLSGALANYRPANPLIPRSSGSQCLSTQQVCGSECIGMVDTCCPVAPNGKQGACGVGDNCWFAPDGSPACCPLFHNCDGTRATNGPPPTFSQPGPSSTPPPQSTVAPPPTVSVPSQVSTTPASSVPPVSSPPAVSSPAGPSSLPPVVVTTRIVTVPCNQTGSAMPTGTGSYTPPNGGAGPTPSSPVVFPGAASTNRYSLAALVGAFLVGGHLFL